MLTQILKRLAVLVTLLLAIQLFAMLEGLNAKDIHLVSAFLGITVLTVLASTYHLGARNTFGALVLALAGFRPKFLADEVYMEFRGRVTTWALFSAHLLASFGLIHVFKNLDDPDKIGSGIAVVLISYVYGALFVLILPGPKSGSTSLATHAIIPGLVNILAFITVLYAVQGK